MLKRRFPGMYARGTSTWLYVRGLVFDLMSGLRSFACQKPERPETGEEEVGPAPNRGERREPAKASPNRTPGDRHVERAIVVADDRIAFVVQILELGIVDPDV